MALTFQDYTANGTAVSFAIPFDRIRDVHVKVFYESTEVTTGWSVVGNNVIFSSPPPNGTIVRVRRITDFSERLVDYVDGSRLNEVDLDNDSKQAFYLIQESRDINDVSMVKNSSGNWEADFDRIQSVANPVANNDAANKLYVDQTANNYANYGVGAPDTRWAFTGNGTALVFNITGATLTTSTYYLVTVNGSVRDPASYTVTPDTITFNSAPANASAIVVVLLGFPRVADSITNASISPTAAIAGTKIAPNFGSQNVVTTGNIALNTASPTRQLHVFRDTAVVSDHTIVLQGGTGGYGAGVSMQSVPSGGSSPVEMARIVADGEDVWNSTTSTQDAGLRFFTTQNETATEKVRINASGNVGIGTSSPQSNLHISGTSAIIRLQDSDTASNNVNALTSFVRFTDSTGSQVGYVGYGGEPNLSVWNVAASNLLMATNNTERLRIDASGNVGIGTSSLSERLTVVGANSRAFEAGGANASIRLAASEGGWLNSFRFLANNGTELGGMIAGGSSQAIGYVGFNVAGSERLRIDSSGNVGIGTSSPAINFKCEVSGGRIGATCNSEPYSFGARHSSSGGFVYFGASNSTSTPDAVISNSAGSSIMTFANSGNCGIGTSSPATRLHVNGTIRYTNRPTAGTITAIGFDANGDLKASSSSLRYKHNVEPYAKGLAEVAQLEPVTFNYNGEELVNAGLIVEDLDELGLEEFVLRDSEGTADAIPYGNMVALLINAIKELKVRVEELETAQ